MRLVIHGGMPKTATTTLQSYLTANEIRLRDTGFLYPRAGRFSERETTHHSLFLSAIPDKSPPFVRPYYSRYSFDDHIALLRAEIDYFKPHTCILSSEYIYSPVFDEDALWNIREQLSFADEIVFYVVLRRPAELLPSMYAQHVTGLSRSARSPRRFLAHEEQVGTFNYDARLRTFAKVFGDENVVAARYCHIRDDVVGAFHSLLGIEPSKEWTHTGSLNERLSWPLVHFARLTNWLPFVHSRWALAALRRVDARLPRGAWRKRLEAPFHPYSPELLKTVDDRWWGAAQIANAIRINHPLRSIRARWSRPR